MLSRPCSALRGFSRSYVVIIVSMKNSSGTVVKKIILFLLNGSSSDIFSTKERQTVSLKSGKTISRVLQIRNPSPIGNYLEWRIHARMQPCSLPCNLMPWLWFFLLFSFLFPFLSFYFSYFFIWETGSFLAWFRYWIFWYYREIGISVSKCSKQKVHLFT